MKNKYTLIICAVSSVLLSCKTLDVEKNYSNKEEILTKKQEAEDRRKDEESKYSYLNELTVEDSFDPDSDDVMIENIGIQSDMESAVIFLDSPDVIYGEVPVSAEKKLVGTDALKQNLKDITILPEYRDGTLKAFSFKEGNVYQIHTQTYHSTIVQLEPGEEMLETPYISEPDVWRLSVGVGEKNGLDTQFIMVKPDYSGLCSTLIMITNRRVYQLELKSYKDHYMPYVQWVYPRTIVFGQSYVEWQDRKKKEDKTVLQFNGTNLQYCSFDYTITHGIKRPVWTPELVYDDGRFTYIVLDKTTLHTEMPTVFIDNRKITNTQVHENVIIINQLITKASLRLGLDKVAIRKKKSKK